jgi:hypothetical protein
MGLVTQGISTAAPISAGCWSHAVKLDEAWRFSNERAKEVSLSGVSS